MGTPAVSALNLGTGSTELGESIFEGVLLGVMKFYGAPYSEEGMVELGQMAHGRFYWLHFAELKHFALQAKEGRFNVKESWSSKDLDGYITGKEEWDGKIYGQLSPALLMKWLDRYAAESTANRAVIYGQSQPVLPELPADAKLVKPEEIEKAMNWKDALLAIKTPDELDAEEQERRRQERLARRRAEFFGPPATPEPATPSPPPVSSANAAELELAIWDFCDRIEAGEKTNSLDDLQFYQNNRAAIEAELKDRRCWLGEDLLKPDKPISQAHAEREKAAELEDLKNGQRQTQA